MNNLLSLAPGIRSPLGLSGGATPFAERGPSFSDLLAAHPPKAAGPSPSATGALASATAGGKEGSASPVNGLADPAATLRSLLAKQPKPGQNSQSQARPGSAKPPIPLANADAATEPSDVLDTPLNVTGEPAEAVPEVLGDLPASTNSASSPAQSAPQSAEALARDTTPLAEPTATPSSTSQPDDIIEADGLPVSQESGDVATVPPADVEPADVPASAAAEPIVSAIPSALIPAPVSNIASGSGTPAIRGPAKKSEAVRAEPVQQADDPRLLKPQDGKATAQMLPSRTSADTPSPDTGTSDFGKLMQASAAEGAAPAIDDASGMTELLPATRADSAKVSAGATSSPGSVPGTVSARPGEIGQQLGLEIVRQVKDGQDALTIRLDPAEMGEIRIRLQFDDRGTMRAHVAAESSVALEMLRRDSADLVRALGDAGVRTDAQSFQFEARSQGRGDQQGSHGRPESPQGQDLANAEPDIDEDQPSPRANLRSSGSLDLFA